MAYERTTDNSKPDQNTKVLADSLDAAVSGALSLYNDQVKASDAEDENNFQSLVAAGNMSLADQLAYRKAQLARTTDTDTRATIRTQIQTLNAQVTQKNFSDGYTKQLQDNAAGVESIDSVISWLQGQLATASDQTVIDKIQSELVTQEGNRFTAVQKTLDDQTTYAKNTGNITTINNQITSLASAKSEALLSGDTATAANIDLQIQSLQQFVATQQITSTLQNLATATVTGSSTATDLLNSYNGQISSSDTSTPITINGVTFASAQAFWTYTRDSYIADTSSSGLFARITKEVTDAVNVKTSNNTIAASDMQAINAQFASLAANPIMAPYAAQLATAKQTALQTAADALSTIVEDNFDQSLDLNKALASLKAISDQGANVDKTTQSILNSAAQTQSQAVQSIMTAANQLIAANPGMSITSAVTSAVASGAGTVIPNNDLLGATPAATAAATLTAEQNKTSPAPNSTTIAQPPGTAPAAPAGGAEPTATAQQIAALPDLAPGASGDSVKTLQNYLIAQGYSIADGATGFYGPETQSAVAAWQKANGIDAQGNAGDFGPISKNFVSSQPVKTPAATPTATPTPTATTPSSQPAPASVPTAAPKPTTPNAPGTTNTPIDFTLHPGETIQAYNERITAARAAQAPAPQPTAAPTSAPASAAPTTSPNPTPTPAPAASSATPSPSSAAAILRSTDGSTPAGLTLAKTNQGGTAYLDKTGNLYVEQSPGIYTLNNSLK